MIDFTASQAQPSAEFARPLRQTILVDTDQRCRIVGHDRHARLYNRAEMALVGEAPRSTAQQTGHDAFDDRSAVATRVGQVHRGRGPYSMQACFVQYPEDLPWSGKWCEGIGVHLSQSHD